jgi:hypothetical protein
MMVSFAMRDNVKYMAKMINFLLNTNDVGALIKETEATREFLERFDKLYKQYKKLIQEAELIAKGEIIYLEYHGNFSISQYTAHEIFYRHPESVVIVVYVNEGIANVSLRWNKDIALATNNSIKDIKNARGGGRGQLAAAFFPAEYLEKFKRNIVNEIRKQT